jgi:hypothetical protein
MASWESGGLVTGEDGGLGVGVDTVVAFSVGDGGQERFWERSTRFGDGYSGVELVAATSCVLVMGQTAVQVRRNSHCPRLLGVLVYGGGASDTTSWTGLKTDESASQQYFS